MDADARDKLIAPYTRYGDQRVEVPAGPALPTSRARPTARPTALHSKIRAEAHHA